MTAKAQVLEAIQKLPDNSSFEEIARRVEMLAGIREAKQQIEKGEGLPVEDVLRELPSWVTKS